MFYICRIMPGHASLLVLLLLVIALPAADSPADPIERIQQTMQTDIARAQAKALKGLRRLQETLTTRGQIDQALLVQSMAERIEAEMPERDVLGNPVVGEPDVVDPPVVEVEQSEAADPGRPAQAAEAGPLTRRLIQIASMRPKTYTGVISQSEPVGGLIVFAAGTKAQGGVQLTVHPGSVIIYQTGASEIQLVNAGGSTDPIFLVFSGSMYRHGFPKDAKGFTENCIYISPDLDFGFTRESLRSCVLLSPQRTGERTRVLFRGPSLVDSLIAHGELTADTMNALDASTVVDCVLEEGRHRASVTQPKRVWDVGQTLRPSMETALYIDAARWVLAPEPKTAMPTGPGLTELDALYEQIDLLKTRFSLEFKK